MYIKYLQKMTLNQIHDRIEELLEMIHKNTDDQDCVVNCEMELASLEQLREELEESESEEIKSREE